MFWRDGECFHRMDVVMNKFPLIFGDIEIIRKNKEEKNGTGIA
jgi:hypothetical protein